MSNDHRPKGFAQLVGLTNVKRQAEIAVKASKIEGVPLPHTLFYGPAGTGKTTLANILAQEMGARFRESIGTILKKPSDICEMVLSLQQGDILFIDEIHGMPRQVQEYLFPTMEDFKFYLKVPEARNPNWSIPVPKFTLIGATTLLRLLDKPLRDRFMLQFQLEPYTIEDMAKIAEFMIGKFELSMDAQTRLDVVKRARGIPRTLKRLLLSIRRFAIAAEVSKVYVGRGFVHRNITLNVVKQAMSIEGIDSLGLTRLDRKFLRVLAKQAPDKVGLEVIASHLSLDKQTVSDTVEPFLLSCGMVTRGTGGRWITEFGLRHLDSLDAALDL